MKELRIWRGVVFARSFLHSGLRVWPFYNGAMPSGEKSHTSGIARAATLTSIGNLSSRVIGLVREGVKSYFFGNGQAASAYELASTFPQQFYDLLIGGLLSSSLVPTFSGLLSKDDDNSRREFGALFGALAGLLAVTLSVLVGFLWLMADPIAQLIAGGPAQDRALVAHLLRFTIPAILFLNFSGLLTAALFARRKFGITAFTATIFNLAFIACMALFEKSLGATAMALGLLMGSMAQLVMQIPGLRGVPVKLSLNWRHPGVSQIVRLFLPVAAGLVLAQIANQISFIVAGRISAEGPASMRYAAQVIQFPLGMVVTAVSAAILPALSAHAFRAGELSEFKQTLGSGLRLVLLLIIPASVGLWILAEPVIALLFQRGEFTAASTQYTAWALRAAIPGLLFAAMDQPLIYAFYARQNTRTPTLIGVVSNVVYLALVFGQMGLAQANVRPFTLADLVLANSLKTGLDALLMAFFLARQIGGFGKLGLETALVKVTLASGVMGLGVWLADRVLINRFVSATFFDHAIVAAGAAAVGGVIFVALAQLLRIPELSLGRLGRAARARFLSGSSGSN